MSNLDTIIDYTKLFQDVELSTALQQLQNNPSQLQQFLQGQQSMVYNDITKQKDESFQKVYGDLQRSLEANEAMLMYNKRSNEVDTMYTQLYDEKKKEVEELQFNKDLAARKYEMNQWSVGNKGDTLFVYSMLFIGLSTALLFSGLWRANLIGTGLLAAILGTLILIFVLTVVYRSQYTDVLRNKRYWDRKIFKGEGGIRIPNICPGAFSGLEKDISSAESSISGKMGRIDTALESSANIIANAGSTVTSTLSQAVTS
jgi:uncharacterized protein YukE